MLASPVPIYLGCAGVIVGSLGLGAQYMLGGNSASVTNAELEQPLFARSVEQASLPTSHWSSQRSDVAHYEPMVKLLTTPSRSVPPAPVVAAPQENTSHANAPQPHPPAASHNVPASAATETATPTTETAQPPRTVPREVVRDIPQETKAPKRTRNARTRDDTTASTGQVDARQAVDPREVDMRSQERQRNARQDGNERRDGAPRRSERRYRDQDDDEFVDTRSRPDRRRADVDEDRPRRGERRVIVQEEPEPRTVRAPEPRDGGFSPFRLFGIFER